MVREDGPWKTEEERGKRGGEREKKKKENKFQKVASPFRVGE